MESRALLANFIKDAPHGGSRFRHGWDDSYRMRAGAPLDRSLDRGNRVQAVWSACHVVGTGARALGDVLHYLPELAPPMVLRIRGSRYIFTRHSPLGSPLRECHTKLASSMGSTSFVVGVIAVDNLRREPVGPQAYDKYHAAKEANAVVLQMPDVNIIGAFNSGIYDYVMNREVVNLDGVVNPDALNTWKHDALPAYLRRRASLT